MPRDKFKIDLTFSENSVHVFEVKYYYLFYYYYYVLFVDLNESMNYHRPQSAASSAMGDTLTTTLQREGLPVDNVDIQRQPVHSG